MRLLLVCSLLIIALRIGCEVVEFPEITDAERLGMHSDIAAKTVVVQNFAGQYIEFVEASKFADWLSDHPDAIIYCITPISYKSHMYGNPTSLIIVYEVCEGEL